MSVHNPTQISASAYSEGLRDGKKQAASEIAKLRADLDEAVGLLNSGAAFASMYRDTAHWCEWEIAARAFLSRQGAKSDG